MSIQPIETSYAGYRFRSRLEARWAVAFDYLHIPWQYEPEGFVLPDGTKYLPDFWLPGEELWVEVKGQAPTLMERSKCCTLSNEGNHPVLMLSGTPGEHTAEIFCWDVGGSGRRFRQLGC
jgi:hypothetical protein